MTALTENQLEVFIYENRDRIHEKGFPKFYKNTVTQFHLPDGKIIDILTWEIKNNSLYLRIIELKKVFIDPEAIKQILGYYGTVHSLCAEKFESINIETVLVGRTITLACDLIVKAIPNLTLLSYDFGFNGPEFMSLVPQRTGHSELKRVDMSNRFILILLSYSHHEGTGFSEDFNTSKEEIAGMTGNSEISEVVLKFNKKFINKNYENVPELRNAITLLSMGTNPYSIIEALIENNIIKN